MLIKRGVVALVVLFFLLSVQLVFAQELQQSCLSVAQDVRDVCAQSTGGQITGGQIAGWKVVLDGQFFAESAPCALRNPRVYDFTFELAGTIDNGSCVIDCLQWSCEAPRARGRFWVWLQGLFS